MSLVAETSLPGPHAAGTSTNGMSPGALPRRARTGAESARYGVLRRLGPALKHDMVVNLQAIAMMAEVLNARLDRGAPDPADFHASIAKLNRLARDAVASCLKVAAWIEPGEDEVIRLPDGIDECMALLASNFNFRGFLVTRDVPDTSFQVSRVALRNLLIASLIALTDGAGGPCHVHVGVQLAGHTAEVHVRISPREDDGEGLPFEPSYRQLEWADVQALAQAEGVQLDCTADEIVLRMPRAMANAPLQIAPTR
jgi:hypothetical protein